jgi:hypothetical protein
MVIKQMQQDPTEAYAWILYLNPDEHINEYKLVKNANLESFILLQDVRNATGPKPSWLSTLPALVSTRERKAYRGSSCLKKLVSIELPPEHLKKLNKKREIW